MLSEKVGLRRLVRTAGGALLISCTFACIPRYSGHRGTRTRPPISAPARAVSIQVSDQVLVTGQVTDDAIPGNALRRRAIAKLPAELRAALRTAGWPSPEGRRAPETTIVARIRADLNLMPDTPWDQGGRSYVFNGVTTLFLEREGRLIEALDVHIPLGEAGARVGGGQVAADWRTYASEVAGALALAVSRSPRLASLGKAAPAPAVAPRARAAVASRQRAAMAELPPVELDLEAEVRPRLGVAPARSPGEPGTAPPPGGRTEDPVAPAGAIAVFEIEDSSRTFDDDTLEQLTEYLAAKVTELLQEPVVPREELRARLLAEKSRGYRDCTDQRCRIELGRALAARRSLSTKILRVGDTCAMTIALHDLETELAERAASTRTACREEDLLFGLDRMVEQLGGLGGQATASKGGHEGDARGVGPGPLDNEAPRGSAEISLDGEVVTFSVGAELLAGGRRDVPLAVELRAPIQNMARRPALNLAVVVDLSASPGAAERTEQLRVGIEALSRYLRADDTLSIVGYSETPVILFPSSRLSGRSAPAAALGELTPSGQADLEPGVGAAVRDMEANIRHNTASHVIVVAGDPIASRRTARSLFAIAEGVRKAGASLSIISAAGDNGSGELLAATAAAGGTFTHLEQDADLPAALAREVSALLGRTMGAVTVELDLERGVELFAAPSRARRDPSGRLYIPAGRLGSGEVASLPFTLSAACRSEGSVSLGRGRLRWRDWSSDRARDQVVEVPLVARCRAPGG